MPREMVRRRVGFNVEWMVEGLVGPQAGHADHAVVGLAQVGPVLAADVRRLGAPCTITVLVDHEHTPHGGRHQGIRI